MHWVAGLSDSGLEDVKEIVRPLASVAVCDLAEMARRLGMIWK